jgi:hypothetical protein
LKGNVIIGKLIPAGSGFGVDGNAPIPSRLDEATLDAMVGGKTAVATAEPEPASEEDIRELMEAGFVPEEPDENDAKEPAESNEVPDEE